MAKNKRPPDLKSVPDSFLFAPDELQTANPKIQK